MLGWFSDSTLGQSPGGMWQLLEIFLIVTTGKDVLLANTG